MKFKVGDLAITQNSDSPEWNDNLLVVVLDARSNMEIRGTSVNYWISRVDGQPFGWVSNDNGDQFFKCTRAWCHESKLRKPEDSNLKEESVIQKRKPTQFELSASSAYEKKIRELG